MIYKVDTHTINVPNTMTGFRPYLSATSPQRREVKALPSMKDDPSRNNSLVLNINYDNYLVQYTTTLKRDQPTYPA